MADAKVILEREYIVPLRRETRKAPNWKRTQKASKALRNFLVKHMKPLDMDGKNVKIGKGLNDLLWKNGIRNPPHTVKLIAKKDDKGIVTADLIGVIKIGAKFYNKPAVKDKKKEEAKVEKKAEAKEAEKPAKEEKKEEPKEETKETPKEEAPEKEEPKEEKAEEKKEEPKEVEHTKEEKAHTKIKDTNPKPDEVKPEVKEPIKDKPKPESKQKENIKENNLN